MTLSMSSTLPSIEVGQFHLQNNAAPSLHAHYRRFIATTSCSVPAHPIGIRTRGFIHHSPLSLHIGRQVPTFHNEACAKVMPPSCRLPPAQYSDTPRAHPGDTASPPVSTASLELFRHLFGGLLSLISLTLTCRGFFHGFPTRSPPRLLDAAAVGGLEPPSERRLRGAYPHLRHSIKDLPFFVRGTQRQKLQFFGARSDASLGAFFGASPGKLLLRFGLADRLLRLEMDSMGPMQNAVQDGICKRRITNVVVPVLNR